MKKHFSKKKFKNIYEMINFKINDKRVFLMVLIIFFTGVLFGSIAGATVSEESTESLLNKLGTINFVEDTNYLWVFLKSFFLNFFMFFTIWFLGLTLIGIPFVFLIDWGFGFLYGATITFFVSAYGIVGLGKSFLYMFPQNIIVLPFVLYLSYISVHISTKIYKNVITNSKNKYVHRNIRKYIILLSYSAGAALLYSTLLVILGPLIFKNLI